MSKAEYLVVDSGGFIKDVPLREIASNIVTLADVIEEIRDKATRQRLKVLPYEIEYRQPTAKGLRVVTEFSKKTGDYSSLSVTDLKVLALTYDLHVEMCGADNLRDEPITKKTVEFYKPGKGVPAGDKKIVGFFDPETSPVTAEEKQPATDNFSSFQFWREPIADIPLDFDVEEEGSTQEWGSIPTGHSDEAHTVFTKHDLDNLENFLRERSFISSFEISSLDTFLIGVLSPSDFEGFDNIARWFKHIQSYPPLSGDGQPKISVELLKMKIEENQNFTLDEVIGEYEDECEIVENESSDEGIILEDNDSDKENDVDDDDDDEEGWITPANLKEKKAAMHGNTEDESRVEVACITTDFAMQNVLKQIGLNIVGANGMVIKETKTWILRCYSCYRTTPLLDKQFCPKCGNKTLKRVSVTLNDDGSQQIHISTRRALTTRGKKFSLPAPKGGKRAFNPGLFEDQRDAQQRISKKAIAKSNPMDPDYISGSSPFTTKDVTSKSAMLGLKGGYGQAKPTGVHWAKKNPNSGSKSTGNKRRK